jgi:putative aldouronate transport system permease protein
MFFEGGIIPYYLNLKTFGLLDNYLVYIIPKAFNFFYVIIMMSYFNDISVSLEESAHMDGAGPFTVYRLIFLPLAVPVIVSIFLFVGVWHWETWFDSMYYTRSPALQTFAAFLMKTIKKFSRLDIDQSSDMDLTSIYRFGGQQGIRFASMVIAIVPVMAIYPFVQKYFVKGIKLGAIKE